MGLDGRGHGSKEASPPFTFWSVCVRVAEGGGLGDGVLGCEDLSGRELSVRHAALVAKPGADVRGSGGGTPPGVVVWQCAGSGERMRVCTLREGGGQAQVRLGERGKGLVYDPGNPVRFYAEGGDGRWDVQLLGYHDTRAHDESESDEGDTKFETNDSDSDGYQGR